MNQQYQSSKQKQILRNQRGQSMVEYLIIVALVAVGTLSIMRVVGHSVSTQFAKIAQALGADVSKDGITNATVNKTDHKKRDMRDFMQGAHPDKSE